jgi:hypothetical protein
MYLKSSLIMLGVLLAALSVVGCDELTTAPGTTASPQVSVRSDPRPVTPPPTHAPIDPVPPKPQPTATATPAPDPDAPMGNEPECEEPDCESATTEEETP